VSAIQNICTCFGVGGLYNPKKRKIESKTGFLAPLSDDWSPADEIQNLSSGMKKRYAKEMSDVSFQLLGLVKKVSLLFKKLHEGRKFLKDITMDICLKDVKTKPTLPLPEQYVEIGLWRQVMQINQQICCKMEELDNMEENSPDNTAEGNTKKSAETVHNRIDKEDNTSTFLDYYMDMVTSSFGDDLDRLRQEGGLNSRKVEMLINCLETGKDIWSDLEKNLLQSLGT